MNEDWITLIQKYTVPGARDKFESICGSLFKSIYPDKNVRIVNVNQGDGGIDIFIGEIGVEPIKVIQCKFFAEGFDKSQENQIRESFKRAINSSEYVMYEWTLCVFSTLNLKENKWWSGWKDRTKTKLSLHKKFIKLIDGDDLIDLLKKHNLYNTAFDKKDSIRIEQIHTSLTSKITLSQLKQTSLKASLFLNNIKNHFEKNQATHIVRKETDDIINWVNSDLELNKKNILILEGDKGLGKSVILKEVYKNLIENGSLVLGIKADKYYATTPKELENKLFLDDKISFSKIIGIIRKTKQKFVLIIDQLDALSQTLSSNREYIQTYNRIINEFIDEVNIRVIISSRTFDLKFDAELSIYKSNQFKNIKTSLLSIEQVSNVLRTFSINCSIQKVLELLRTPNHLEIFCKLPNKDRIDLNALSSLKNLYDELWNSIVTKREHLKARELLYSIADEMYQHQKIIINSKLLPDNSELNYLLSSQLLITDGTNIQFFHQTFYDYCFARQFVEKGNDIFVYLNSNQQNLEIRSVLKMVFEYLREYNHTKYIAYNILILKSSKYRFHIQSLLISILAIVNPSDQEKLIFKKYISNKNTFNNIFLSSVYSEKWIDYLIDQKYFEGLVTNIKKLPHKLYDIYTKQNTLTYSKLEDFNFNRIKENNKNNLFLILQNNINKAPYQILNYVDQLNDFSGKDYLVSRLLSYAENTKNDYFLKYFEKYISYKEDHSRNSNFWFYDILEKLSSSNPNYVFRRLKPIIIDKLNNKASYSMKFDHNEQDVLKELYKSHPEDTFSFLLTIYIEAINNDKRVKFYAEVNSPYFDCNKYQSTDYFNRFDKGYLYIEKHLLSHLISFKKNKTYIIWFYEKYKNTNSVYLIRLIIQLFKEQKESYVNYIYDVLNIIYSKNGFNGIDDKFQLYTRQLIAETFSLFSSTQKEKIIEILLSIKYVYDLRCYKYSDSHGKKIISFSGYGKKQYLFLKLIHKEELYKYPKLKYTYLELERKFGSIDANKALDISSYTGVYSVGTPLETKAYENMNLRTWKTSILKFGDDYIEGHGPKGGKFEHSRAFSEAVKSKPNYFYNFILDLFSEQRISLDYIISGIEGLIDGKYEPLEVLKLIKLLIKIELDRNDIFNIIRKTQYLINNEVIDPDIFDFLCRNALTHPDPESQIDEDESLTKGINSVRGTAIRKVISCYKQKEYSESIFKTVEKSIHDKSDSVKISILDKLAFLNHLDLDRNFKIFIQLTNTDKLDILKSSIRASQYFDLKFHFKMYPYFNKIIMNKELHNNGQLIILGWLNNKINDKKLYNRFISSSQEAKLCALDISEHHLFNKKNELNVKALEILNQFLKEKDKDNKFKSAYSGLILREIKHSNFLRVYDFLFKYSKTNLCIKDPRYFFMLLIESAKHHPLECLNLIKNIKFNLLSDPDEGSYYGKEPVQLILAIYSKLNLNSKEYKKEIEEVLNVFDSMLTLNIFKTSANKAIELTLL